MQVKLNAKLLTHTPDPEKVVATAAKLCYSSDNIDELITKVADSDVGKFLDMLAGIGHYSTFEHVSFTFLIEGVSRSLTHQMVRHRVGSPSQKSQRFVGETQFKYIVPKDIDNNRTLKESYIQGMKDDQHLYNLLSELLYTVYACEQEGIKIDETTLSLISLMKETMYQVDRTAEYMKTINRLCIESSGKETIEGLCDINTLFGGIRKSYDEIVYILNKCIDGLGKVILPENIKGSNQLWKKAYENARYILPNACETKIMFTFNVRSLINFFAHRCCNRAQDEIRELAEAMYRLVVPVAPNLFKFAGPDCFTTGKCSEGKMTCKQMTEVVDKYSNIIKLVKEV